MNDEAKSEIALLAEKQLTAYNNHDLDAFVACYHQEVTVLDTDGKVTTKGLEAFRKNYEGMFAKGNFGATVETRIQFKDHCVDLEHWHRFRDGEEKRGTVLVRYRLRDGLIGTVQFLR
ncbi:nuclear transport factor 2 family protein [Roseibacillus persicicus]|uniref:nuclear transport factor 2 family protein n=1 Tax=Roseibacillus persicicus TaxID=454148 RepID=UPI00398A6781